MKITIEVDDKELKGLIFGEEEPKTKVNYVKAIEYRSRIEWERLFFMLKDLADKYDIVTVADYLDITGERASLYTDNLYGWTKSMIYDGKIISNDEYNYRLILPDSIKLT